MWAILLSPWFQGMAARGHGCDADIQKKKGKRLTGTSMVIIDGGRGLQKLDVVWSLRARFHEGSFAESLKKFWPRWFCSLEFNMAKNETTYTG